MILPLQSNTDSELKVTEAMREFVKQNDEKMSTEKIHFSTIYANKQRQFMDEFKGGEANKLVCFFFQMTKKN